MHAHSWLLGLFPEQAQDEVFAERRDALVHELMHLKRRDLWAFQAARIVAATQWFNPLAHIALKAFRTVVRRIQAAKQHAS